MTPATATAQFETSHIAAATEAWPWYALRVRSNFEQTAAIALQAKGYEHLLPTYTSIRRWSDRVRQIQTPLFPGYVFCRFNPFDRFPLISVPGVAGVVSFGKELASIDETEIAALKTAVKSGLGAAPWPFLRTGAKVAIQQGPLRGVEGVVVESQSGCLLVVSVTLLQRSVSIAMDRGWLRPL